MIVIILFRKNYKRTVLIKICGSKLLDYEFFIKSCDYMDELCDDDDNNWLFHFDYNYHRKICLKNCLK